MKRLILIALLVSPAFAANVNIDGLPAANPVAGTDLFECEQGGINRKCTGNDIRAFVNSQFDILNYGAKCDGVTNDNAAINAAITAAFNSVAYQNNNAVAITGPSGNGGAGCLMNSLDFTKFTKGNAANPRPRVEFYGMTLLCTGAGNICIDGLNSQFFHIHDISLRGDVAPNSPEIGIQIGVSTPATSSAFHVFERISVNNEFSLAGMISVASETFNCFSCYITNAHTANGPVGTLGSVTAGSSYTNGTYTNVSLTGGSGTGAQATVVVAGTVVSTVRITNQGRDYVPADSLSAAAANIGGTGSGFSVPVSTVTPYSFIMDCQNHWNVQSAFTSVTLSRDTWISCTGIKFFGGSIRQNGAGRAALWVARSEGLHFFQTYFYGGAATPSYCYELFDNGITKSNIPTGNSSLNLNTANCEGGLTGEIFLTGSNATPILGGFRLYEAIASTKPFVFVEDTNITGVTMPLAEIRIDFFTSAAQAIFKTPSLYTITGNAMVPTTTNWGSPASFTGQLCTTTSCITH